MDSTSRRPKAIPRISRRSALPRGDDERPLRAIPYRLRLRLYRERIDATLRAGEVVESAIEPAASGPFRSYVIDVPANTSCLRLDLVADRADLDLRVRYGEGMTSMEEADLVAASSAGSETMIVRPTKSATMLRPGRYYVDVVDPAWLEWPTPFRLVARFDPSPPAGLLELPRFRPAKSALERALQATVELLHSEAGGSGVLISERGYILTNHHVIEAVTAGGGARGEPIMIAFNTDPHEPPKVRCLGRVVAYDARRDLALVRIVSDLYGRPIPEDYRFPAATLGEPQRLTLTDELFAIGYPDIGGLGTRVAITVSRGIVSGFERRGEAVHIKTDAEINSGNSGGPVLDAHFRLIGIATEVIPEQGGNGQLGYVRPLWLVPAAWWRAAGIER